MQDAGCMTTYRRFRVPRSEIRVSDIRDPGSQIDLVGSGSWVALHPCLVVRLSV